jgi:hypothetical protein
MSLAACIPELLASGKIKKADADRANRTYKRHFEGLRGAMGDEAAAAEATTRALDELDYAAKLKRRQAGLQIRAQQKLDAAMDAGVEKGMAPHRTLTEGLRRVEIARERLENQSHEGMLDFVEHHRRNMLGQAKDKAGLVNVVDELHGKATGNEMAATFAKAVGDTFERLRLRFNRAGGDIAKREDFGLPHRWDALKVRRAGFDQFKADVLGELAPEKMVDPLSGGQFTPERLDEFLHAAFKNISTNGLSEISGAGGVSSRMLANRRTDPRFMTFKDGAAWLRVAAKYGEGNPFEAIMAHVNGMARDIAFMEAMGPNPAASWQRGMDRANRVAANSDTKMTGAISGTSPAQYHADKMWRYMNGDLSIPVLPEGDGLVAGLKRGAIGALHGTRDVLTSALLGSAQLTSIVDVNTNAFARKFNALPAANVLMGYLKQLNPLDASHREHAVYLAAGARDATRSLQGLARWFGETQGPRWSQILADDVLRVTGMNKFFEAGRNAFVSDYYAQMGRERGLSYDQLPEGRRWAFERHGITPEEWDVIRSADPAKFKGVDYVDWHAVAAKDEAVADKMVDAVLREARSAVLETDAASQSVVRADRPGTLWGELAQNTVQFKSFPLALVMDQARRVAEISERKGKVAAGTYLASFIVGMTLLGAVSMQLKEIVKGKDMRDPTSPDFWFDAFVQGGGAGVIGDLVGSVSKDRVSGPAEYIGGPMVSLVSDAAGVVRSGVKKDEATGERGVDFGNQATRFLRRYTPGTTIWYLRAAIDRLLWDELQERVDPDYAEHQQRLQDAARRQGQGFWWEPGENAPDRLPQVAEKPQ